MQNRDWTRVLFEAIDDAVVVHDEEGKILEANPAACRRLGYSRDEMLTMSTSDIDAPEFAAGFKNRLQMELESGVMRCEGVHRAKDGSRIVVDINASAVRLDGKPAVLAVMRDITKRKQTEDELAKQSQLLTSILDNMSDAIVVADAKERIILFNPSAERIFGPGLVQGGFTLQLTDRVGEVCELPVGYCVRGEWFDGMELLVRHDAAPKGLWISIAGRPLREKDGSIKGGVLVCHDITLRKRDELRMQAHNELADVIASDREVSEAAREILHIVCEAFDFEAGILWGADAGHKALCCLETWDPARARTRTFLNDSQLCILEPTSDLAGVVWQEGEARQHQVTEVAPASERWQSAQQAGLCIVCAFPIHTGSDTIGVLELWRTWMEGTDDALWSLLQAMANQVGQFLDRQRVEKELRDSRALYESLVQNLPQNIFRKDRAGRVIFCNQRYCVTLNHSLAELMGKNDFDLFPAPLAEKYVQDDQHIMRTGQSLDTIEEHQLPDGNQLFVHVVKTPVRNAENEIVGVQGIFWDVTQEVRANQAIAASEKRYRQLTEATMDGIVVIDSHGDITLFNPAAERMFGYRPDEVVGAPANLLVPEEFQLMQEEGVAEYLRQRLQEQFGSPHEFKGRRKDGTDFPVEIALSLLTDPSGGATLDQPPLLILAAIRDLTERNKMRAFLVQNEKLASIGLLSAGVAHEINNPLAFVGNNLAVLDRDCMGLLALLDMYGSVQATIEREHPDLARRIQTLVEEIDLPYIRENMERLLNRTRDGIDRVTRIVHSLRGMARTEAPRRQEVRVSDLIDSNLEILHGNFKRLGVAVEQVHNEQPLVSCVPTQISQVVLNLLMNAFQAIDATRRSDGRITIRSRRLPGEVLLEIEDNGTGIQPEHMVKLFDPFFTTKDVGEGTGLGLSISHHIITAHGGRIEVDGQPGVGAIFRVYLPLSPPSIQP
jgi:PAS domain S-box-containing protein